MMLCLAAVLCCACGAEAQYVGGDTQATDSAGAAAEADGALEEEQGDAEPLTSLADSAPEEGEADATAQGPTADTPVGEDAVASGNDAAVEAGGDSGSTEPDGPGEVVPEPEPTSPSDPSEAGEFGVEVMTHTETLETAGGAEDVLMVIYMPEGDGPFPVVVFTHGFQLAPADYASYGEHLASWGYVAILPQFPGGLFGGPTHVDLGNYLAALLDWVEADTVVLSGKVDATRIGLAGHSMGGKISLLLASEDDRPMAVFGVDPVDAAGGPIPMPEADYPSVTPERMDSITVPLGLLGETTNGASEGVFGQACAPAEDNFQAYFDHAESPAIVIDVLGASHMSFLDNPECGLACFACPSGTDDPATSRMLAQRYMVAFFNVFVQGNTGYMDYLTGDAMASDVAAGLVSSETKNAF
ncbi:MAG: alpha/beta hydrolase family protein [Myxococcota bacterium]